jgi:hypothetical protein
MDIEITRIALGALWIAAMAAVGWATGLESLTSRVVLAALTLALPILLARFWPAPANSMSPTSQDALR